MARLRHVQTLEKFKKFKHGHLRGIPTIQRSVHKNGMHQVQRTKAAISESPLKWLTPKNNILNLRGKIMAMLLNLVTMDRVMLRAASPYGAGASVLGTPCSR